MTKSHIRSASEQLADTLREEIMHQKWKETMPGVHILVREFQVGNETVRAALTHLEKEGLLVPRGRGRRRGIAIPETGQLPRRFRIRILLYEKCDAGLPENASLLARLQGAGFAADFAAKSLHDLRMDVGRVSRFVGRNPVEAWIVLAASREINEWFSQQSFPAMALFGRQDGLDIAATYPVMIPSLVAGVRRLISLGHRRIVMFTREERRKPNLSRPEQAFIDELEAAGIATGNYNLPDWDESPAGLKRRIDELFRLSGPTAIIFQETPIFIATRLHLADRGIIAPRDVSLITADPDPSLAWCDPMPSHFRWNHDLLTRKVVQWAKNVSRGKDDRRKRIAKSEFIEGGTIGPVPKGR